MRLCNCLCVRLCAALAIYGLAATACAINYNETGNGDLSGSNAAPTNWGTLTLGTNSLIGNVGIDSDLDYVRLDVPSASFLTQIILQTYIDPNDGTSFIGMNFGATINTPPGSPSAAALHGYAHFGNQPEPGNIGTDLLDDMSTAAGAQGFATPLGPGTYSFWIQNTSNVTTDYQFNFIVVPEPSGIALIGLGVASLLFPIRRARTTLASTKKGKSA